MEHAERYARAREFYDVVTGLWDSWADDAFIRDVESGIYFDPGKLHVLNHKGKYLSVRGPLNIARPIQGWPVIVQAGASDAGRQLAAETAEVVFAAGGPTSQTRQRFYADVKGRAAKLGRNPDHIKILPGAFVVVGDTRRRGAREAGAARQPGAATTAASPRCRSRSATMRRRLRSRRAAARDPRDQREQERPRAGDRRWPSARTSPCASSPSASAAMAGSPWSARPR